MNHNKPVNIINGVTRGLVPPELLPEELRKETQYLIKSTAKLYAGINGTGRLYELSDSSGFLQASRIDSTIHSGSQFGALCFTKGDSIFSFGGYGYWKYNGTLRQFNFATRDWMALPLEIETKGMFADFNWVDSANNTLYLEDLMLQSEALLPYPPKKITPPELITIHWASGKVQSLGKLTYNPHYGLQSPWGKLDFSAHEVTLYDFRHNRIYHAKKDLFLQMRKLKNPRHHAFHFMMDSTLYYGNTENNYLDSIRMSITQFETTGNPIYEKKTKMEIDGRYFWILLIPFVTLIGAGWIRRRGAVWQNTNTRSETSSTIAPDKNLVNELTSRQITPAFTAAEIALLDLLVKKGEKNEAASVDEVNKLLGLANKNDDVQKKNRSEFILLINQKWALTHGNEHPLIERQRSDTDRRSFEYFLAAQWRDELNNWMS